jgi:hypothetical protein
MTHRLLSASLALAALSGMAGLPSRCAAKPPDLPANQRIIVYPDLSPLPPEGPPLVWPIQEGILVDLEAGEVPAPVQKGTWLLPEPVIGRFGFFVPPPAPPMNGPWIGFPYVLTPSLLYSTHPFVWLQNADGGCSEAQPAVTPGAATSVCPWMRQQQTPKPSPTAQESLASVLDNLAKLEQASQTLDKARQLLRKGRVQEGLECLQAVRTLCPGSGFDERVNEIMADLFAGAFVAPESETAAGMTLPSGYYLKHPPQYFPPSPPFPVPRELASQELEDLPQACLDFWESFEACLRDGLRWCQGVMQGEISSAPTIDPGDDAAGPPGGTALPSRPGASGEPSHPPTERATLLGSRLSVHYTNVPLGIVLEDLCASQVVPVRVDLGALQAAGVSLAHPVTLHADNIPFQLAVDLLLRQAGLTCRAHEGPLVITCSPGQPGSEEESEPRSEVKQPVCPNAEALHARHEAGVRVQVEGLLKACYLALEDGRSEKAADLARQAHALAPELVEADPVLYKLHLVAGSSVGAGRSRHEPEKCEAPACPAVSRGPSNLTLPAPPEQPCPEGLVVPCPPPVDQGVVAALDALLREFETAEAAKTPCPAPTLRDNVEEWVDAFRNGHGQMMFGLGLGGLNAQFQSKAHGRVYTVQMSGKCLWWWSAADNQAESEESAEEPDGDE